MANKNMQELVANGYIIFASVPEGGLSSLLLGDRVAFAFAVDITLFALLQGCELRVAFSMLGMGTKNMELCVFSLSLMFLHVFWELVCC